MDKVDAFVKGRGAGKKFIGCHSVKDLCANLKRPRRVMLMVRAGSAVDETFNQILPFLEAGDILIDGGNSHYADSNRRRAELQAKGVLFIGAGISGGEEGALNGPSIMPGGSDAAWPHVKEIFQGICARADGAPCCEWVGDDGAGHFVKMVHNGIEYGDMQLIAESYHMMKRVLHMNNDEIAATFQEWNKGDLDSYLIEITGQIFAKRDPLDESRYLIDQILDAAGQKGTGKWTAINALDLGMPLTLIGEAVFARCLSSLKTERIAASKVLEGPPPGPKEDRVEMLAALQNAVFCSKLISYAQGFTLMREAAREYKWRLHYGNIALMWRGGCIIRSTFLGKIKDAFDANENLPNLLLDPFFHEKIRHAQAGWRRVVAAGAIHGVPLPTIGSALAYYDGYRAEVLPANLLQAQRDYFGAHTFKRLDNPSGPDNHFDWTGHGGNTSSTTYTV